MTSRVEPLSTVRPLSSNTAREHSEVTAAMLWLTNRTVRPRPGHILHLAEALLLEGGVADGEDLVHDQDLGLEVGRHGEGEAHEHAARVALHRRVEEPTDLAELDDLVELALDLGSRHPQDGAVELDVLASGELGVEPGADLEQARHPAL